MPRTKKDENPCLLGIKPGTPGGKCPTDTACRSCGWNRDEARLRLWQIRTLGLTDGPDGTAHLALRHH